MKYRRILTHLFFAILVGVFVLLNNSDLISNKFDSFPQNSEVNKTRETAKVSRVIDGDTIKVLINNKEEIIRLIGIDAPEAVDSRKTVECFGREASNKAEEILDGKTITLESDPTQGEKDEYGRLLRYVFLEDGTNFNKLMIDQGYAREYTFKGNTYNYQSQFIQAAKEARGNNKGLWNSC